MVFIVLLKLVETAKSEYSLSRTRPEKFVHIAYFDVLEMLRWAVKTAETLCLIAKTAEKGERLE